jgi:hypothetical protein
LYKAVHRIMRQADRGLALNGSGALVDAVVEMARFDEAGLFERTRIANAALSADVPFQGYGSTPIPTGCSSASARGQARPKGRPTGTVTERGCRQGHNASDRSAIIGDVPAKPQWS